ASLGPLVGRLRFATPQWSAQLKPALLRAKQRLAHACVADNEWYWPTREKPTAPRYAPDDRVRLLAPFDPIVWDRRRFSLLWGWNYRFEAYTPAGKRKLGYYALPLLWRDHVIGWANVTMTNKRLDCQLGFNAARPREPAFDRALEAELDRLRAFLAD
ncbi:MAG TPA: crosslink repair DNA glycosylase YcaQ family protein, partial [Polyangiales bacterium]|nr:crosslink repair DNA glycosylase YcaQ family protein [Polyangiales bacterium]